MTGRHRIVVPLVDSDHAVDVACRIADAGARLELVAPLVVEQELPLDAQFPAEIPHLKDMLDRAGAIADSYGLGVHRRVIRMREGGLGRAIAEVAEDCGAQLVVVGSDRMLPRDVRAILRDAPCPVLVATGSA